MKNAIKGNFFILALMTYKTFFFVVPTSQELKPTKRRPNSSLPNEAKDFRNVHNLCSNEELLGMLLLDGILNARRHLKKHIAKTKTFLNPQNGQ